MAKDETHAAKRVEQLRDEIRNQGRDPAKFCIEVWLRIHDPDPQQWSIAADGWRRLGADFVMLYPMFRLPKFEQQIETLRRFKALAIG